MTTETDTQSKRKSNAADILTGRVAAAGPGVARLNVPGWIKITRFAIALGIFCTVFTALIYLAVKATEWSWLATGVNAGVALALAALLTTSAAATWLWWTRGPVESLLNLKREDKRLYWAGFFPTLGGRLRPLLAIALMPACIAAAFVLASSLAKKFPLPHTLKRFTASVTLPASNSGLQPLYLWDYGTWFDPAWLEKINLLIPYEKGPPQKLLSKVFFEDAKKHEIVLELHGKRPRWYAREAVAAVFQANALHPADWSLLWQLTREAGVLGHTSSLWWGSISRNAPGENKPLSPPNDLKPTDLVGVPWQGLEFGGPQAQPSAMGKFFFWGPDGSVFQVRCPAPCELSRMLELVAFPDDPRGSAAGRLKWTEERLKSVLADRPKANASAAEKLRHENLLSLYLVSLLTQDPRDPEAFFHLGKLAKNLETVYAAIRYGRDLGLEPAKIAELEAVTQQLSH